MVLTQAGPSLKLDTALGRSLWPGSKRRRRPQQEEPAARPWQTGEVALSSLPPSGTSLSAGTSR